MIRKIRQKKTCPFSLLKEHFQRLLENGMLERNGQGRGVWYRVK
jgi:hypothetical protein